MPRGGSKPGERRGGRQKGGLNKRTVGMQQAIKEANAMTDAAADRQNLSFDSLDQLRAISRTLISMAASEQRRERPDPRWLLELLNAGAKVCACLLPYEHRRLASVGIDVEALMKGDGNRLYVSISPVDADA